MKQELKSIKDGIEMFFICLGMFIMPWNALEGKK